MFEKFTSEARRVVVLAQEEARDMGHDFIGPEHLLIRLTEAGVAGEILTSLGLSPDDVRSKVSDFLCLGAAAPAGHIMFNPSAVRVLERANMVRLAAASPVVEPEHILLALATFGELSSALYGRLGLKQSELHEATTALLKIRVPEPKTPVHPSFDVYVDSHGEVHANAAAAALASPDGSSRRARLTLAPSEFFAMTRGPGGEVVPEARYLDYPMARASADALGCVVVVMTPGTEEIRALDTKGNIVAVGKATVFVPSFPSERLVITD